MLCAARTHRATPRCCLLPEPPSNFVVVRYPVEVASGGDQRGRVVLQHVLGQLLDVLRGDRVDLPAGGHRVLALAVGQDLPSHVLEENQPRFQLGQNVALEHVSGPGELYVSDGLYRHTGQLIGENRYQFGDLVGHGCARADPEETALVGKGRKRLRGFHPSVAVEDLLVHPAVHALARPTGRKRGSPAQECLENARGHHAVRVPASHGEGEGYPALFFLRQHLLVDGFRGRLFYDLVPAPVNTRIGDGGRALFHRAKVFVCHRNQFVVGNPGPRDDHSPGVVPDVVSVKVFREPCVEERDALGRREMGLSELLARSVGSHLQCFAQGQFRNLLLCLKGHDFLRVVDFRRSL
mmetsp:Transcript_28929/g.62044  ORF Transcript_28929/g.62044 Transcript_28929/m.62044 type:complete len:352 (-) Transcript_28929:1002-2057(-)